MLTRYTTRLYERDENNKFWPAGQFTFDSRKRAVASLEHNVCEGICGIVTTNNWISQYKGMTESEALRVSPVKLLAIGR